MRCIYCNEDKEPQLFRRAEHIIPQSFGRFRNNLTLHQKVCDECNQFFGDNIENWLARDTYEGLFRYSEGFRTPENYQNMGSQSILEIKVNEGVFKNSIAYLKYNRDVDQLQIYPFSQIGFKLNDSNEYEYHKCSDILQEDCFDTSPYNLEDPDSFIFLNLTEEDEQKIFSKIGISCGSNEEREEINLESDSLEVEITSYLTQTILRCIAKIAFNYLSYWNDTDIMLYECFDPVRNYIRYGVATEIPIVSVSNDAVLTDEQQSEQRRIGHLLTVNKNVYGDSILSQVSLFNFNKYKCILCWGRIPEELSLAHGNFFNLNTMEIQELGFRTLI